MTIKFEFTLSDVDAANLIAILHEEKVRIMVKAQEFIKPEMTKVDQANRQWYNGHAEYLERLKPKVLAGSVRVEG